MKRKSGARTKAETKPKFPYTTKPSSLRRLLQEIPSKPRPPKFDKQLLGSWGFKDGNDYSMVRVLKGVGMLSASNEPTEQYTKFMDISSGASALTESIRKVYEPLFHASHEPFRENQDKLQNLFHIHSGGSERAIEQQIQTFKALCEHAELKNIPPATGASATQTGPGTQPENQQNISGGPSINISLHIHLPENKTRRDYECIIEDIARYIIQREPSGGSSNE